MTPLKSVPTPAALQTPFGAEVYRGLTARPRTLSPWLFYDEEGSRLFEQITELPEYYLTRTERALFTAHADEIVSRAAGGRELTVVELGAGTATKTGLLLSAAVRRQGSVDYYPIDVSATALDEAQNHLEDELPGVTVHPRVGDYTDGLGQIDAHGTGKLVLYIGSSIGNFEPRAAAQLLADVRRELAPGDTLLLGADKAPHAGKSGGKSGAMLLAAYNDASGVTAAFNRNVLARINRELDADFELDCFRHDARWNAAESRIEMHLESRVAQRVTIPALELEVSFAARETIHTENSYKFDDRRLLSLFARAGFRLLEQWKDREEWFGVYLAEAI
jgi:L-histidine N-alpha-methyltransferase